LTAFKATSRLDRLKVKLLIGGSGRYPVEGFEQGLFVQPQFFDAVKGDGDHTEEIFGPAILGDDLQR